MKRLQQVFNVQANELPPVLILSAYFFLLIGTNLVARTARDSYFLSRFEAEALPLVMLMVPVATIITVALLNWLSRRIKLIGLIMGSGVFFAATLALTQLFLSDVLVVFLYVWVEVISIVMFFQFYLLAGMVFNARQAKRLFGLIGTGGTLGAIVVGFTLTPFVDRFGADLLLFIAAGLILGWVLVARLATPHISLESQEAAAETASSGRPHKIYDGYLVTIMASVVLMILVATIVDYQYKITAKETFSNTAALATFFTLFMAFVGVAQLIMRLFVVGRVLATLGILIGLLLLPLAMGLISLLLLLSPMLLTAVILKGADQGLRYTVTEASSELLWVPVALARKIVAKPIVNGMVLSLSQGAAALLILFIAPLLEVQQISLVVLVCVAVWIPVTFRLRRGYVQQLVLSIENRELALETLTIDLNDQTIITTIDRSLRNEDVTIVAFSLGLIEDLNLSPWAETLNRLLHHDSPLIQQRVLHMASDYPDIVADDDLLRLTEIGNEVALEAMTIIGQRKIAGAIPLLERFLGSEDPNLQAAAAKAIILMDAGPLERARGTLRRMLQQPDENITRIALKRLRGMPVELTSPIVSKAIMLGLLDKEAATIHEISLELMDKDASSAQEMENRNAIQKIAYTLRRPRTAPLAREILTDYPPEMVVQVLTELGRAPGLSAALLIGIIETLKNYPTDTTIDFLLPLLETPQLSIFDHTVDTLLSISRQRRLPAAVLDRLDTVTLRMARLAYGSLNVLAMLDDLDELLIREMIRSDVQQALPLLVKLGGMHSPDAPIEVVLDHLKSAGHVNWANVAEILDNVFVREERELIIPLFEQRSVQQCAALARQHFTDLPGTLEEAMAGHIEAPDDWHAVVAIDYLLRHDRINLLTSMNWRLVITSTARKEPFLRHLSHDGSALLNLPGFPQRLFLREAEKIQEKLALLSTLEKTILLKSANLFKDITASDLYHVAQISEEMSLAPGAVLFEEGDMGDAMYIVAQGQMRIYRQDVQIALMSKGDALGEIAVLDRQTRSASASAVDAVTLLRIARDDFYDLMASNQEIMQGVIKLLTGRLRTTNQLLVQQEHHSA